MSDAGTTGKQAGPYIFNRAIAPDRIQFKTVIECVVADFFNRPRKNDFL